ncbi:MAG: isoprenylcysteine carboxyl methyltransferase [Myxococcales bacterium 68-20]|nr:isoprenylcysteine carboxylmethyltransferase family protein [Myxococcales bacterium]OJY22140.1 MAG: isoprenylcysteine carboxyl methyltransferase [Myxococcales bacterium 68-20]
MVAWLGRLATILLASAAYFGLAVLGWGGAAALFAHSSLAVLAVVMAALAIASAFSKGNVSSGTREDRSNRWVIVAFGVLGLLVGYLPALTDRIDLWTLDGEPVRWTGVALFALGGVLRLWPVFVLGNRFSGLVAIQPEHSLETGGIYGVIRHPSYLGLIVSSVGWVLAFRSGVGLLLVALMGLPLFARIRSEERLLHAQFGDEWEAYSARTPRLIPRLD